MKTIVRTVSLVLVLSVSAACVPLAAATGASDSATPAVASAPASINDALARGKFSLNARLRWEHADQDGLLDADAFTLRTRFGYTTAPLHDIQVMLEAENIVSLGDRDDYNAAGTNPGGAGRTVIADPPVTELNQAWIAHGSERLTARLGRQRLVLDNARFVGDVGWRQNAQTFDAFTLQGEPAADFRAFYGYVNQVNRVFGDLTPQPDFDSDSHLFNLAYRGWSVGTLTAYAYWLDFDNAVVNSSATYGASFVGSYPLSPTVKLNYRAELATQQDAGDNPTDYSATYHAIEVGVVVAPFDLAIGHEVLGSDDGLRGFATPLATLHAFNGWADVFLATPPTGLRDLYVSGGVALPGGFPLRIVYHEFSADSGGANYGSEWDAQISHKLDKNWTLLAKVAAFDGTAPRPDITRYWLQAEFNF